MIMKTNVFLIIFFFSLCSFAQEKNTEANTIDTQFNTIYRKSTSYQEYKVIGKIAYKDLQKNVLDSIKKLNTELKSKNTQISTQNATIKKFDTDNKELTAKLTDAIDNENSITLFGISLTKGLFKIILFTIIIALLIFLGFFVYKFKNSNVLTVAAKDNLEDVENEYTIFRKKSIEREQKLRRQLQDEIIKNKNS